jgi:hypothetical protein
MSDCPDARFVEDIASGPDESSLGRFFVSITKHYAPHVLSFAPVICSGIRSADRLGAYEQLDKGRKVTPTMAQGLCIERSGRGGGADGVLFVKIERARHAYWGTRQSGKAHSPGYEQSRQGRKFEGKGGKRGRECGGRERSDKTIACERFGKEGRGKEGSERWFVESN